MIYSVFRPDGFYDYYRGPGRVALGTPPPAPRRLNPEKSYPVEAGLVLLPAGARRIGRGIWARGRVATMPGRLHVSGLAAESAEQKIAPATRWFEDPVKAPAFILAGAFAAYWALKKISWTLWPKANP